MTKSGIPRLGSSAQPWQCVAISGRISVRYISKLGPLNHITERISMTALALIIKHQTQPGKREEVRKVWEKHMAPAIASNPGYRVLLLLRQY